LFGNAVERGRGKVVTALASNRNATWPMGMFELAMAATGGDQDPTFLFQAPDDVADFQGCSFRSPAWSVDGGSTATQP